MKSYCVQLRVYTWILLTTLAAVRVVNTYGNPFEMNM